MKNGHKKHGKNTRLLPRRPSSACKRSAKSLNMPCVPKDNFPEVYTSVTASLNPAILAGYSGDPEQLLQEISGKTHATWNRKVDGYVLMGSWKAALEARNCFMDIAGIQNMALVPNELPAYQDPSLTKTMVSSEDNDSIFHKQIVALDTETVLPQTSLDNSNRDEDSTFHQLQRKTSMEDTQVKNQISYMEKSMITNNSSINGSILGVFRKDSIKDKSLQRKELVSGCGAEEPSSELHKPTEELPEETLVPVCSAQENSVTIANDIVSDCGRVCDGLQNELVEPTSKEVEKPQTYKPVFCDEETKEQNQLPAITDLNMETCSPQMLEIRLPSSLKVECPACGKSLSLMPMIRHMISSSACIRKCREKTDCPSPIIRILDAVEKVQDRYCPLCKKRYNTAQRAIYHFINQLCSKNKHSHKRFKMDEILLKYGVTYKPGTKFLRCSCCGEKRSNPKLMRKHIEKVHMPKKFTCDKCPAEFALKESYECHQKYHNNNARYVQCQFCDQKVTKNYLQTHVKLVHSENELKCHICDFKASNPLYVRRHIATMHGEKNNLCDVCGKYFASRTLLRKHVKVVHEGMKPTKKYKALSCRCSICDMEVLRKNLKTHIKRRHGSGGKDYTCVTCLKSFSSQTYLKEHARTHIPRDEREQVMKFECDLCGKKFPKMNILKEHVHYVHNSDKVFTCGVCGKTYRRHTGLERHQQFSCSGNSNVACLYCKTSFASPKMLRDHIFKEHGDIKPDKIINHGKRSDMVDGKSSEEAEAVSEVLEKVAISSSVDSLPVVQYTYSVVPGELSSTGADDIPQDAECGVALLEGSEQFEETVTDKPMQGICTAATEGHISSRTLPKDLEHTGGDSKTVVILARVVEDPNAEVSSSFDRTDVQEVEVIFENSSVPNQGGTLVNVGDSQIPNGPVSQIEEISNPAHGLSGSCLSVPHTLKLSKAEASPLSTVSLKSSGVNTVDLTEYKCGYCNGLFPSLDDVKLHIYNYHP